MNNWHYFQEPLFKISGVYRLTIEKSFKMKRNLLVILEIVLIMLSLIYMESKCNAPANDNDAQGKIGSQKKW